MRLEPVHFIATALFAVALVHTFSTRQIERLAHRYPRHAGALHLLGEVEVAFGLWAIVFVFALALAAGAERALEYAASRNYTEPLFVFVVMVIAGSRPIVEVMFTLVARLADLAPARNAVAACWLSLGAVPLLGSLITEPAAMTIAALLLAPHVFRKDVPERAKYIVVGALFVNVSIGGTLTAYAAPPVLMVAGAWNWDSAHMVSHFGAKAAVAVAVNATLATWLVKKHLGSAAVASSSSRSGQNRRAVPRIITAVHVLFLAAVVALAHRADGFLVLFLLFLGFTHAFKEHQDPLLIKQASLVAFFLAGLVVLGGMQQWWLQPIVSSLDPLALFFAALALTAVTDNAALTYLGSLVQGIGEEARYMLVAGAVAGGGLTVIANAPNPAGVALLKTGFADDTIGAGGLLLGAAVPTVVAVVAFLV